MTPEGGASRSSDAGPPALLVAVAASTTLILALAALHARPHGNIARGMPYLVAEGAVLGAAAWLRWGGRALALVAACYLALVSAGVVAYLLLVEPIAYAECGTIVEEMGNAACRSHAHGRLALAGVVAGTGVVAVVAARTTRPGRHR